MATMTLDFLDTALHYPNGLVQQKYSSGSGSIAIETLAPFASQPVFQSSFAGRALRTPSEYVYVATKVVTGADGMLFYLQNDSQVTNSIGIAWIGGYLCLFKGNFTNPTIAGSIAAAGGIMNSGVYYTVELALRLHATASSIETRLNNTRVPALTTSDFTPGQGQPAGLIVTPPDTSLGSGSFNLARFLGLGIVNGKRHAWTVIKTGSSPWTSLPTIGSSLYVNVSDFVGDRKRAYLRPVASAGNYTLAGGNWDDGVGSFPASLADASGSFSSGDSDGSYIINATAPATPGTPGSADKFSMNYEDLPGTATSIGAVQRVTHARSAFSNSAQLQTFRRSGGVDYADTPTIALGDASYQYKLTPHDTPANSSNIWTPTSVNAIEGGIATYTLT